MVYKIKSDSEIVGLTHTTRILILTIIAFNKPNLSQK